MICAHRLQHCRLCWHSLLVGRELSLYSGKVLSLSSTSKRVLGFFRRYLKVRMWLCLDDLHMSLTSSAIGPHPFKATPTGCVVPEVPEQHVARRLTFDGSCATSLTFIDVGFILY